MIRWDAPGPYEVVFTTRAGGVSEGRFASLNLGRMLGDEAERVDENRRRVCAELAVGAERLALNVQRHTAVVNHAEPRLRGVIGDGLWTEEPSLPLLALTADCLPIALVRSNGARPAAAVLHAGWKGLLAGIVEAAVKTLRGKLVAAVGPAIGPCCYEVREDVARPFRTRFGADVVRGRTLDLWTSAERALRESGVRSIERLDLCTACDSDRFFSYRRDGKPHGGQGVVAVLR